MRPVRTLLLLALALSFGCKGTEAFLSDLHTATDAGGGSSINVYDSDLLIHEAMVGIMDQEVLTLSQMGRAVHHCGRIIEKNKSALLRADAVSLLTHLALRYPIPALEAAFAKDKRIDGIATEAINALDAALKPLEAETRIGGLTNPDKVVAEENWVQLRRLTGQEIPQDVSAWEAWWEENEAQFVAEAQEKGRDPLKTLAYLRYGSLASSRAVLGYLATRLAVSDLPALRDDMRTAQLRLARLVVEYGIIRALRDESPIVRSEAARASRRVLAASFGDALAMSYAREVDSEVKVQILKSLEWYPGRTTLELCLVAISDTERPVSLTSRSVLTAMAGEDHGEQPSAWHVWWEREGKTRWP